MGTGLSPGSAVAGFPPGVVVNGSIHIADGPAGAAQGDLTAAYVDAAGRTAPAIVAGDLGGLTLPPGLYKSTSSIGITGVLTLDGQGDSNSVFIFQVGSALSTAVGSQVMLIGGARASNIFWQIGSSAVIGTNSIFNGTIMAQASITLTTGAALNGRALARTGAVTLDSNTVVNPGPPTIGGTLPPALTLTCPASAAQTAVAYNSVAGATGGTPPYVFTITTGSLPTGLTLNGSTGVITGIPSTVATSTFSINVRDSASVNASQSCSIATSAAVLPAVSVSCPANSAQANVAYNSLLIASGGTRVYTFSISFGGLPPGLTLSASTGAISGTPAGAGFSSFGVSVRDSASGNASQSCSIVTSGTPPLTPAPSSLLLVLMGAGFLAVYRSREWLLQRVKGH